MQPEQTYQTWYLSPRLQTPGESVLVRSAMTRSYHGTPLLSRAGGQNKKAPPLNEERRGLCLPVKSVVYHHAARRMLHKLNHPIGAGQHDAIVATMLRPPNSILELPLRQHPVLITEALIIVAVGKQVPFGDGAQNDPRT